MARQATGEAVVTPEAEAGGMRAALRQNRSRHCQAQPTAFTPAPASSVARHLSEQLIDLENYSLAQKIRPHFRPHCPDYVMFGSGLDMSHILRH
jgi:hypothetical protein